MSYDKSKGGKLNNKHVSSPYFRMKGWLFNSGNVIGSKYRVTMMKDLAWKYRMSFPM